MASGQPAERQRRWKEKWSPFVAGSVEAKKGWLDWLGTLAITIGLLYSWIKGSDWALMLGMAVYILAALGSWIIRRVVNGRIAARLREAEYLLCWDCGYDLRGAVEERCPECGEVFSKDELGSKWRRWEARVR